MNVLIADDHSIVREGWKRLLAKDSDISIAGEAATAEEIMTKLSLLQIDVVLLDLGLPDRSGMTVLEEIRAEYPEARVLIVSMYGEEQFASRALKNGASGYITKENAPATLLEALKTVAAGGIYVSKSMTAKMIQSIRGDSNTPPHEELSAREFELLCLIAAGQSLKEIAGQLFLSVKTVRNHRASIYRKMSMKNDAELTLYAARNGLVK